MELKYFLLLRLAALLLVGVLKVGCLQYRCEILRRIPIEFHSGIDNSQLHEFVLWKDIGISIQLASLCSRYSLSLERCDSLYTSFREAHDALWSRDDLSFDEQVDILDRCNSLVEAEEARVLAERIQKNIQRDSQVPWQIQVIQYCRKALIQSASCINFLKHSELQQESQPIETLTDFQVGTSSSTHNVWFFWNTGYSFMPKLIQLSLTYNLNQCKKYQLNCHFVTLANLAAYIDDDSLPTQFKDLSGVQQSDILRIVLLQKYGGIYLDTDYIITDDLRSLFDLPSPLGTVFFNEYDAKCGNSIIIAHKNSPVLRKMFELVTERLDWRDQRCRDDHYFLPRHFIGPDVVLEISRLGYEEVFRDVSDSGIPFIQMGQYVRFVDGNFASQSVNFAGWEKNPIFNVEIWFKPTPEEAQRQAKHIKTFGLPIIATWTLSSINSLADLIFLHPNSVFFQMINMNNF